MHCNKEKLIYLVENVLFLGRVKHVTLRMIDTPMGGLRHIAFIEMHAWFQSPSANRIRSIINQYGMYDLKSTLNLRLMKHVYDVPEAFTFPL